MMPYIMMFVVVAGAALIEKRAVTWNDSGRQLPLIWVLMIVGLTLVIGLRHEVGGDWGNYILNMYVFKGSPVVEAIWHDDPAYALLNWFGANIGGGIYFVNTVCGLIFAFGLVSFCRIQTRPFLSLAVATPYLVFVVAMGYTRQGVAIGLAMLGMKALMGANYWSFFRWMFVAALFHKSAIVLIPMALFSGRQKNWIKWPGVLITAALIYTLMLAENLDNFIEQYVEAEYASSGAAVRVLMNALPALLFLLFRERFALPVHARQFWTWMSVAALGFVVLLGISPSSTAVDRIALYWIPLQLFILSNLPAALGERNQSNRDWVFVVLGYSFAILIVWFIFATHSFAWIPYRFYPAVTFE